MTAIVPVVILLKLKQSEVIVIMSLIVTRIVVIVIRHKSVRTVCAFRVFVPLTLLSLLPFFSPELLARVGEVEEFVVTRIFIVNDDLVVATAIIPLDGPELLWVAHLKTIALNKQVSFLRFFFGHIIDHTL